MTAADPTPAVERAADAITQRWHQHAAEGTSAPVEDFALTFAPLALTAALTDPADPDWLARTLFQIHLASDPNMIPGEESLELWPIMSDGSRAHWRAVADGLRATITGSGE